MQELRLILNDLKFNHVILIDDARLFIGKNDYPTIDEVKHLVFSYIPDWTVRLTAVLG